ncbi:LRR receptor-like serine/threonine-protein kinase GSO2-like [Planoprotostelium fungivorum]|uniref:LRR receptor-like serine/threonine-protein kinase GSO2-like n=1 Tax=Planoprotostelium fungivorum TaxID=1890364 RepID=A0A2P6NW38_9EUKA|nr:LRR receptor-like serine/threonine-protein kinase GSO2-like [Planoprotostelium fungivorum]
MSSTTDRKVSQPKEQASGCRIEQRSECMGALLGGTTQTLAEMKLEVNFVGAIGLSGWCGIVPCRCEPDEGAICQTFTPFCPIKFDKSTVRQAAENMRAYLYVLIVLCTFYSPTTSQAPYGAILQSFYESTNGPNWVNQTGWANVTTHYCSQFIFGITCVDSPYGILPAYLILPGNNLTGNIESLSFASFIGVLNLSSNQLTGALPPLNGMFSMQSLDLSNNQLEGPLPALPVSLQQLILQNNVLTGSISSVSELIHMRYLDLSLNQFSGELPDMSAMANLTYLGLNINRLKGNMPPHLGTNNMYLQYVNLSANILEGPIPGDLNVAVNLTALDLSFNQLNSDLPASLCNHSALQFIDLGYNQLTGQIPDIDWPRLVYLGLGDNDFHGTIPEGIYNSLYLTYFLMSGNALTGGLSASIGRLHYLSILMLQSNLLNGSIPSELGQLPALGSVLLAYNGFSGSLSFNDSSFRKLQVFDVTGNNLTGNFPTALTDMPMCQSIMMGGNQLSGIVPQFNSSSLLLLDLSRNQLSGSIDFIRSIRNLASLNLYGNDFSGSIPSEVTQLKNLVSFVVSYNNLTGNLPSSIGNLVNLQQLDVSYNSLSGTIPRSIGNLKSVQKVLLHHNQMTGAVPFQWQMLGELLYWDISYNRFNRLEFQSIYGSLPKLVHMDMSYNQIASSLTGLGALTSLQVMKLNNNKMTGALVTDIQALTNLIELDLSVNEITGPLSYTMGSLINLQKCNISYNKLSGIFPDSISLLANLQSSDCSSNQFYGNLPYILGGMTQLTFFNISNNNFSGDIPNSMSNLTNLATLDLSNNKFNGTIMNDIGRMISLQTLDFSRNQLAGSIPTSFGRLRNLQQVNFSSNALEGLVPSLDSEPRSMDLSNNQLSGDLSFIPSLGSFETLILSNNTFDGNLTDISGSNKLVHLDLSHNHLGGSILSLNNLPSLQYLNLSQNLLVGSVPSTLQMTSLTNFDLSHNNLSEISDLPYNLTVNSSVCSLAFNNFSCPIPWPAFDLCGTTCNLYDRSTQTTRLRIQGDLSSFSSSKFLQSLSTALNITSSRLKILSTSSGSVIVDLSVGPPPPGAKNEGSATRVIQMISFINNSDPKRLQSVGIDLIQVSDIPPTTKNSISTGGIIAIVVVILVLIIVGAIVITIFMLRRWKARQLRNIPNPWEMMDLSNIKMGEAKRSVVDYNECTNFHLIGAGAYGVVYTCHWRETVVAMKQIRSEMISEDQLKEFLQEVAILRSLRTHPNVVLFLGLTFPPQPLSLITEYCEGGSLYTYLRANEVPNEVKLSFIKGIARGMLHLHLEKVVHRDLAARNILLTKHLEPKVSDFGLSREQKDDSAAHTRSEVGPIKWMAPESIKERIYSTKTDVYSFGTTIWEVFAVEDPYKDMTVVEVAIHISANNPCSLKIPPEVDPMYAKLMQDCWSARPEDRPEFGDICALIDATNDVVIHESPPNSQPTSKVSGVLGKFSRASGNSKKTKSTSSGKPGSKGSGDKAENETNHSNSQILIGPNTGQTLNSYERSLISAMENSPSRHYAAAHTSIREGRADTNTVYGKIN